MNYLAGDATSEVYFYASNLTVVALWLLLDYYCTDECWNVAFNALEEGWGDYLYDD